MQRYRDWLDDIEATEDAELDDLLAEAEASDDERRKEVTRVSSIRRRCSVT